MAACRQLNALVDEPPGVDIPHVYRLYHVGALAVICSDVKAEIAAELASHADLIVHHVLRPEVRIGHAVEV